MNTERQYTEFCGAFLMLNSSYMISKPQSKTSNKMTLKVITHKLYLHEVDLGAFFDQNNNFCISET